MKKTLCVIPAKGRSLGIPKKNIALLNGKPLVSYALQACLDSKCLSRIVVSSEDPEVLNIVSSFDERLCLKRPCELAQDDSSSHSVVLHALEALESNGEGPFDYIILVQITNPLVLPEDIDAVMACMLETHADSCVTVTKIDHMHPSKFMILDQDRLKSYGGEEVFGKRRQDLPKFYIRNGSCYASKRETVLSGSLMGDDTRGVVVPPERFVDIHTPLDIKVAEAHLYYIKNLRMTKEQHV